MAGEVAAGSRLPGRPFATCVDESRGYAPAAAALVTELRTMIFERFGGLKGFHRAAAVDLGLRLTYQELSRQLSDGRRFPEGPETRVVDAIIARCDPSRRSRVDRLRRELGVAPIPWPPASGAPGVSADTGPDRPASAPALVVGMSDGGADDVAVRARELGDVLSELNDRRPDRVRLLIDPAPVDVEREVRVGAAAVLPDEEPDGPVIHLHGAGRQTARSLYFPDVDPPDALDLDALVNRIDDGGGPAVLLLFDVEVAARSGRRGREWTDAPRAPARAALLGAVVPDDSALAGLFSDAVAAVLRRLHESRLPVDPEERYVPLEYLRTEIRRELNRSAGADGFPFDLLVEMLPAGPDAPHRYFTNRRYEPNRFVRYQRITDDSARRFLDDLELTIPALDAAHYFSRAAARPTLDLEAPILFTGREPELGACETWLAAREPQSGLRVVTGQPGAGKSSLLGMIVCALHPGLADVLPRFRTAGARPGPGEFAAVHARGLMVREVVLAIAAQLRLGTGVTSAAALGDALAALPAGAPVPSIVVDALDEASAPIDHVDLLLQSLARLHRTATPGRPACRILVGTRPWPEFAGLLRAAEESGGLHDLDAIPLDRQRTELRSYLAARLRSPFLGERAVADHEVAGWADIVSDDLTDPRRDSRERGGPFLVATLFAHHLMRAGAGRRGRSAARVPRDLGEVLELDLAGMGPDRLLRPLLVALAHAREPGMPPRLLGAAAASIATRAAREHLADPSADVPDPRRVEDLLTKIGFYLRRTPGQDGTTHYRFFHQALSDHLRRHPDGPPEELG